MLVDAFFSGSLDGVGEAARGLEADGYDGVLSMECEGQGGEMIGRSLAWLRSALSGMGVQS